jgi:hypothetical protein
VLTVGSPALAGYSLALTIMNSRWVYKRFNGITYSNRDNAVRVLCILQQLPLEVVSDNGLLASLVVLPENDLWWEDLVERLDHGYTWSIATATNIAWVVVAFMFTVVDSFTNLGFKIYSNGQAVGSLWLWLLAIIVGWMQVPIFSHEMLLRALDKANSIAYVAGEDVPEVDASKPPDINPPIQARRISDERGIGICRKKEAQYSDEGKTPPIFNYARVWGLTELVEEVASVFEEASRKAIICQPVRPKTTWVEADRGVQIHPANRAGSVSQVHAYCGYSLMNIVEPRRMWVSGTISRVIIASICGLALQWGTTASAALMMIFEPTVGLGCRSGAYFLYGIFSTLVWFMLLISSMLNRYCWIKSPKDTIQRRRSSINSISIASTLSDFLRRTAALIAFGNSAWIIIISVFQFANYFDTCYCNSSVLGLGSRNAYISISQDLSVINMKGVWIGCTVLAGGCIAAYAFFVALMMELPVTTSN